MYELKESEAALGHETILRQGRVPETRNHAFHMLVAALVHFPQTLSHTKSENLSRKSTRMFEATLAQGNLLKKIIDSIKDLVSEANWECNQEGINLQSMDSSQVALIALLLRADGFEPYRCDRNMTLGIKIESMQKILKCAGTFYFSIHSCMHL